MRDFELILTGHRRRQEHDVNQTRHILSFIRAFSGMGASEYVSPAELWPLSIDLEGQKQMITTFEQAKKLFKEFV